jgi:hypothetical protein
MSLCECRGCNNPGAVQIWYGKESPVTLCEDHAEEWQDGSLTVTAGGTTLIP